MFRVDQRDVRFVLYDQLRIQDLAFEKAPYEDFDRATCDMLLDEAIRYSTEVLSPLNEISDRVGATFADGQVTMPPGTTEAFDVFASSGWVGLVHNPEYGGAGAPLILGSVASEMFEAACLAFNLTRLLTDGCGHLIEAFGNEEQKATYVPKMYAGEWTGTMCLTEAGAGTDVGASRATATPEGDHYLIEGEKVFITSGNHDLTENIIHAVLARTPDSPPGTRGLSLVIVPWKRLDENGNVGEPNLAFAPAKAEVMLAGDRSALDLLL